MLYILVTGPRSQPTDIYSSNLSTSLAYLQQQQQQQQQQKEDQPEPRLIRFTKTDKREAGSQPASQQLAVWPRLG